MTATALQVAQMQDRAVVAAALAWHRAQSPEDVDTACENLHRAVESMISQSDRLFSLASMEMAGHTAVATDRRSR